MQSSTLDIPMPPLSIVIVNYHTRELVLECLATIEATEFGRKCEVIVIDNASGDGCLEEVRGRFADVRTVANAENRYFSAAYTQGIELATAPLVLALNPDTRVLGNTLEQLVAALLNDPAVGAITTNMYFDDGTLQRNCSEFMPWAYLVFSNTPLRRMGGAALRGYRDKIWYGDWDRISARDVDVLPGSCILASRKTWLTARAFDPLLLMYFSDDLFSRRVRALGLRNRYVISDGIVHLESVSARKFSRRTRLLYLRDLVTYCRLVWGRAAELITALLILPSWLWNALRRGSKS